MMPSSSPSCIVGGELRGMKQENFVLFCFVLFFFICLPRDDSVLNVLDRKIQA